MIGYKIRFLREKLNISPKDFADTLDIDLSTLNRIENNKITSFKPDFLLNVAEQLKTNIAEIFDQNSAVAIQHNQKGQNINVLNQQPPIQKADKIDDNTIVWQKLVAAQEKTITAQQAQIESLLAENKQLRGQA